MSVAAAAAAFLTGFLGSDTTLLFTLRRHEKQLSDLERRFRDCMDQKEARRQKTRIISFHEEKRTRLLGWLSIGFVSANSPCVTNCLIIFEIVTQDSAQSYGPPSIPINTDHSGLNKCGGREDTLYEELTNVLDKLRPYVVSIQVCVTSS
jgi:hypothetical protein